MGWQKTLSFLAHNYYYPKIKDIIYLYIKNCYTYRCIKTSKNWYNNILKFLKIFMNF